MNSEDQVLIAILQMLLFLISFRDTYDIFFSKDQRDNIENRIFLIGYSIVFLIITWMGLNIK